MFKEPRQIGVRAMFGMPYHSITAHFAEWYRLLPLSSINAESHERMFKDIKMSTTSTNFHDDHLIMNSLIRLQEKKHGASLKQQNGRISKEWNRLIPRRNVIITKAMIEEDVLGFAAHRKRIADYLLDGVWHTVDDRGNWHFHDGEVEEEERVSASLKAMHIRYEI